ncbi:MAG: winged helix-turn-helix transcriptional regulator [Candidatus Marsarchaeota archaeon]|nr:winged helix-turn-helix transcriptional regulator [Candidatus Marsarchaeota archaeon]
MSAEAWCPVERVTRSYGLNRKEIVDLVRMNWRAIVLEIIVTNKKSMTYGMIAEESGLNSKTLSSILKILTNENMLERHEIKGVKKRVEYSATIIGKRIATMPCPLLRYSLEKKRIKPESKERHN